MEYPSIPETTLIIGIIGGVVSLIVFPLAGAFLLWLSTKIFRFNKKSFLLSLACIFIAFGCVTAVNMVFAMLLFEQLQIEKYAVLFGISMIATGIISEIVAVKFLFRESVWKAIGATLLSMVIGLVLYIALITAIVFLFFEQIKTIYQLPV